MRDNAIKYINPFENPFKPRKFEMTKTRNNAHNNPFLMGPNNIEELSFNNTIKSKPRPMHYPKLENNEDDKEDYFSGNSKAPFHKGEINYNTVLRGYKQIKESKEKEKEREDGKYVIRPNINIYICYPNSYSPNSKTNNKEPREKSELEEKKNNPFINFKKEKREDLFKLIVDLDEKNDAPAADIISDFSTQFEKMKIGDKKVPNKKDEISEEKLYTNDGMETPGQFYID